MRQPKIRIQTFANMGDNGIYWLDNMAAKKVNGQDILKPVWNTYKLHQSSETGYADLRPFNHCAKFSFNDSTDYAACASSNNLFVVAPLFSNQSLGKVHYWGASGGFHFSNYPQISVTTTGNLMYTSEDHVGLAYKKTVASGTSTSLTVTGFDFTAAGITNTEPNKYVYNLTKGVEYVVTSVSGAGNNTINFASTTAPETNDVILAFVDTKFSFGTTGVRDEHFPGQEFPYLWTRDIVLIGDEYWMNNGNYLATLNIDETTFASDAVRLPYNTHGNSLASNRSNLLAGCSYDGKGRLVLYSVADNEISSIIDTELPVTSVVAHKSGWLYYMGDAVYYTDGYTVTFVERIPDAAGFGTAHNKLLLYDNKLFIGFTGVNYARNKSGIWILDLVNGGWNYSKVAGLSDKMAYVGGALYQNTYNGFPVILTSIDNGAGYNISILNTSPSKKYSAMFFIKLPAKTKLGTVELALSPSERSINVSAPISVTVNYGDGNDYLWGYSQAGTGSTTTSLANTSGSVYPGKVGKQIIFAEGTTAGERSYITAVTGTGNNEVWTIAPALSTTPTTSSDIITTGLYLADTKTVDQTAVGPSLFFNIKNFYSDKLFLEVVFDASNGGYLDLYGINIY